ncbi:hypothetical protein BKA61DRAFT_624635 [Leptodontidium sp. MPI-SDFR-AT-0119]|nr:hypothetical protein BKA61DRAFT_624635 [Leptodontidium sp. MPI-SDFR-AT-0119]
MSAEVAKKRGRPKKVISDPVEVGVEITESAKKVGTTRAKSTKTVAKATKAAKGDGVKKSVVKAGGASAGLKSVPKIEEAPGKSGVKEGVKVVGGKSTPARPATTTAAATSKILEQVKEMEAKKAGVSQESAKGTTAAVGKGLAPEAAKEVERSQQELATKESKSGVTAKSNPVPPQQKPSSSSKSPDPKIVAKQPPPPQPPVGKTTPPPSSPPPSAKPTPTPKSHIPLAQLNSTIVSNITTRAGARPNTPGSQQLPKNYKPVARKVTMAIVALPILIVTSYVLYQRLVLGEEKKMLVQPQQNPVRGEVKKAEPPSTFGNQSSCA